MKILNYATIALVVTLAVIIGCQPVPQSLPEEYTRNDSNLTLEASPDLHVIMQSRQKFLITSDETVGDVVIKFYNPESRPQSFYYDIEARSSSDFDRIVFSQYGGIITDLGANKTVTATIFPDVTTDRYLYHPTNTRIYELTGDTTP